MKNVVRIFSKGHEGAPANNGRTMLTHAYGWWTHVPASLKGDVPLMRI
jgi:hypothetical protein